MAAPISYLDKLQFDQRLNNTFIARYLKNTRLVILTILVISIVGVISFLSLPRVLNPAINIAIVTVQTSLPGASPDAVESLLTNPIEKAVGNVANIDTITSTSQNSVSVVSIQFNSGVDPDKAQSDVQTAVQTVNNLPKDATVPHVGKVDFQNAPVWVITVSSHDPVSLLRFSRTLRDTLKDVATIDTVNATGLDSQEIQVVIKPEAITTYGINPLTLSQIVTTAINAQPAGNINTTSSSFSLTVDPLVTTVSDLRKLRIGLTDGTTVLLSNIATVQLNQTPGSTNSYVATRFHTPVPGITFSIFKKKFANITTADQDAHTTISQLLVGYNGEVTVSSILDSGDEITRQFTELVRDLLITFFLVFLVIVIFLGTRQAAIAAFAIPLTFLITFIVMRVTHIDLSFIAFFSLLLSLGLLVDDTIVVISALSSYHRTHKFTPFQSGLLVWRDFKTAIFTTTLTTVWAFVPLLLSTGIIGEFIKAIPIVVSSALLSSFGVAMFITLPLVIIVLKPSIPYRVTILFRLILFLIIAVFFFSLFPKGIFFIPSLVLFCLTVFIYLQIRGVLFPRLRERGAAFWKMITRSQNTAGSKSGVNTLGKYFDQGIISFSVISEKYRKVLDSILSKKGNRRKTLAIVIIFSLFSYLLLPLGFVRNEFFPASSQPSLTITIEFPSGTNIEKTKQESLKILQDVVNFPEVKVASLDLGSAGDMGFGPVSGGSNMSAITLVLPPLAEQKVSSIDLADQIRKKYAGYQKGKLSVVEQSGGPPAGADVQIKLFGDNLTQLDSYANTIIAYLKTQPGITNVDKSIKSGTSKIVFIPDFQKMSDAGVTQDQIGLWLRTFASGFTLDSNVKLEEGNTQGQDIVLRSDAKTASVQHLSELVIPTQNGSVPMSSLGTFTIRPNPTLITHEAEKRTLSVSASVTKGYSVSQANTKLEAFANSLHLSNGYSWKTGGVNQQNNDSITSILQAMVLSFLLIIITMVLQFSSFRKALIVMLVIPLSISGVFIVFALTHTPLSFPALIGILALFGIVVKNSILIVDKINQNLKAGLAFKNAIVDASESRLEPIALTSFTAIVGLIPITLSNALWQKNK